VRNCWIQAALVCLVGGLAVAGLFSMAVEPLRSVGWLAIPFWLAALGLVAVGAVVALTLVDLARVFVSTLATAAVGTAMYAVAVWSPAASLPHYSTRLANYATVQSVPVIMIALVAIVAGAIAGTIINTAARGYEL
jgi:hypothetical protein